MWGGGGSGLVRASNDPPPPRGVLKQWPGAGGGGGIEGCRAVGRSSEEVGVWRAVGRGSDVPVAHACRSAGQRAGGLHSRGLWSTGRLRDR